MSAQTPKPRRRWRLTRRGLLIGAGAVGVLAVAGKYGLDIGRQKIAAAFDSGDSSFGAPPNKPELWLEVAKDNTVTLYTPKIEMGQGIHTALAQIAAEELGADWKTIRVVQASTERGFGDSAMSTSGSVSVAASYKPLREAAATMLEMLKTEAASQLGVAANALRVGQGRFEADRKTLSYGEVVAAKQGEWQAPKEAVKLQEKPQRSFVGQSVPRVDLREKIVGKAVYGYDARVEGMFYGAVARPPRYGAKIKAVSTVHAEALPGVEKIVVDVAKNFAGVVAKSRSQARKAVAALMIEWEGGSNWNQEDLLKAVDANQSGGVVFAKQGKGKGALGTGKLVDAQYRIPLAAHAQLEPQAALVHVMPDRVEAWISTQVPQTARQGIVNATGYKKEQIAITPTYLGGGFGRKSGMDIAFEAAMLSKAINKPVHVGWTRTEELRYGYFRPPSHNVLRGAVEGGKIVALEHRIACGDIFLGIGIFPEVVGKLFGFDPATPGFPVYDLPNFEGQVFRTQLPVPTGWWRSLGTIPNVFALESFMDEMASAAGVDPLEFRLNHLGDSDMDLRLKAVLQKAAELAGWGQPAPAGRGRGIACCKYGKTAVALVAEVSLDGNQVRVERMTAAIDCGLVINPSGAEAQAQGAIVMGLSSALLEKITLKDGMAEAENFGQYPLLTIQQTPKIEVSFINSQNHLEPFGMGEPGIGPVAPAVANAVSALTGKRVRELPLQLV